MRMPITRELTLQDELAFEQIVFRQRHRLFTIALGIPRDRGEAEDAVQETLISLLWLMVPVMIVAIIALFFIWVATQPGSFF